MQIYYYYEFKFNLTLLKTNANYKIYYSNLVDY